MKNMTVKIGVVLLLTVQVWFCVTMFRYPYLDIDISNKNGEWVVQAIDHRSPVFRTVLKKGDTVLRIDGELPEKHVSVKRWGSIDQAKTIEFIKDGSIQIIDTSKFHTISSQDFSSFAGGLVGISISILFFFGIKHSLSSRYLSFVFLSIGFTFMSLGASLRGDLLGKISIGVCIILIPVVLVHFLIVFFERERENKNF
ncbi:hypothetical protein OMP38_26040 [Cohnella ginsengisoli]|uniref:Histidine kinase n=1 Tax=Cohnella ginsengisoli TaxID=425004 RepID=A0A9X4KKS5_9BACL|nr:hypothetical protein [Cohnella ginsengisoli]MDG0793898.1 hypothetical protein [Cohnella ginsengisoli]